MAPTALFYLLSVTNIRAGMRSSFIKNNELVQLLKILVELHKNRNFHVIFCRTII